jgi:MFS family permease
MSNELRESLNNNNRTVDNSALISSDNDGSMTMDDLVEQPDNKVAIQEEEEEPPIDMIDASYTAMGGFGRFQKLSYAINTLVNVGAAFIIQSFVFVTKQPIYRCRIPIGTTGGWSQWSRED